MTGRTPAGWTTNSTSASCSTIRLMTDMRDPLTQRFHRAKLRADLLRPADAGDLLDDSDAARQYLDAVEEYVTAFDVAEAEAMRRRRRDFSREEQQRLSRAP